MAPFFKALCVLCFYMFWSCFCFLACKYELPGIAQRKVIYHLLPARVLVTWSFCTYKILSELHLQEINDHDNRLPLMPQIMELHNQAEASCMLRPGCMCIISSYMSSLGWTHYSAESSTDVTIPQDLKLPLRKTASFTLFASWTSCKVYCWLLFSVCMVLVKPLINAVSILRVY